MRNVELIAGFIAAAIRENNGGRITQKQSGGIIASISAEVDPSELADSIKELTNVSQFNQELERFGLVKTDRTASALIVAIQKELAK